MPELSYRATCSENAVEEAEKPKGLDQFDQDRTRNCRFDGNFGLIAHEDNTWERLQNLDWRPRRDAERP